ncbi:6-pyruvoyl-tetrahydropterin synthase-related protein [Patescibacteria group bacterium]|nr:6-pyruvoyl-tetrahydropterin synthase-related protein [Patescibacteria group bacterium]
MFIKLKANWPYLVIFVLSLLVVWPLFYSGYFSHHDDLQVMRIFEMRRCLVDGQIPCRWVPDMGWGNGYPLFNYYSVLPYYVGALFSFLVGFIWAAKILFFIPLFLGGFAVFILAKELVNKTAALATASLFIFAPYRALDAYVRGDVTESLAIAVVPLVFYYILRLVKQPDLVNFLKLSLFLSIFLLSHNIMIMLFGPVLFVWSVYWLVILRSKAAVKLFLSAILSVGIASFFLLPAFLEKNLVQTENLITFDLNFRAHFVTVSQLFFSRFWGYGASVLGPNDTISFQIGWPHWWLVGLSILVCLLGLSQLIFPRLINRLINNKWFPWQKITSAQLSLLSLLLVIFFGAALMTHNKSAIIWEQFPILQYTQFPWRFLSIVILSASLVGGVFVATLKPRRQIYATLLILVLAVGLNLGFFHPDKYYFNLTDQQKLSGQLWDDQRQASILDYLPKTAIEPKQAAPNQPMITQGSAQITNFINYSNRFNFGIDVNQEAEVEVPVFDFPNWIVLVNSKLYTHDHNDFLGRIELNLPPGKYFIAGVFTNTMIRNVANVVSLSALILFLILLVYAKFRKNIK